MSDLEKGICANCCCDLDPHEVTKCERCGYDGLCPDCAADAIMHACTASGPGEDDDAA